MKELSIQEKAKRYDEAIEIAKKINNEHKAQPFDVMLKVFPELKENEDERIRKALIDYFDDANKADENPLQIYGIHTDKALAWLEKQKDTLKDTLKDIKQKPAWSEEDEDYCLDVNAAVDDYCAEGYAEELHDWLKSLKDRVQPQSKQEWSEKDEEMYKEVLTDIIYAKNDMKAKECIGLSKRAMKAFNWFSKRYKSLRPQNTWKPSESDILLLERIANGKSEPQDFQASLYALIGQLKNLREE